MVNPHHVAGSLPGWPSHGTQFGISNFWQADEKVGEAVGAQEDVELELDMVELELDMVKLELDMVDLELDMVELALM